MKPHTPIPLVLCDGKEDLLVMETLAKQAGLAPRFPDRNIEMRSLPPFRLCMESRPAPQNQVVLPPVQKNLSNGASTDAEWLANLADVKSMESQQFLSRSMKFRHSLDS